jgi:hypothetical protein
LQGRGINNGVHVKEEEKKGNLFGVEKVNPNESDEDSDEQEEPSENNESDSDQSIDNEEE